MHRSNVPECINEFTTNLFRAVRTTNKENIFFGSASIYSLISMLYPGAKGATAAELKEVLCLPQNSQKFSELFCKLWADVLKANNSSLECILSVANRIWAHGGTKIEDSYMKELKEKYQSDAVDMDFLDDLESTVKQINDWVEGKTNGKIKDMLDPGKISRNTKLLITNAMYFYGEWTIPFNAADTEKMVFYLPNGAINVEMMYKKATFAYGESAEYDCKLILLPYRKSSLRLMIVLPNRNDGLSTLEEILCGRDFNELELWKHVMLDYLEVNVYLPKFRICGKTDLVEPLKSLGLQKLFSDADLSGISKTIDLSVSSISHAAYIDVNEKGTEIAASNTSEMVAAGMSRYREFKVDHPSLFMVIDYDTEVILFLGRLYQPVTP